MTAHPAAALFPMMSPSELSDLIGDICANGLLDPIVRHEGLILDGRNRLAACEKAGVTPRFREWSGESGTPTAFVISANLHRRQLTKAQIAAIGAEAMPLLEAEAEGRREEGQRRGGLTAGRGRPIAPGTSVPGAIGPTTTNAGRSRQVASDQLGGAVSGMSIQRAKAVKDIAPEVFEKIKTGDITISAGLREAGLNFNGTKPGMSQRVSSARRHDAVIQAASTFVKRAGGGVWAAEMCAVLTPPQARKQLTVLNKAAALLAEVIEAVEYRADTLATFRR